MAMCGCRSAQDRKELTVVTLLMADSRRRLQYLPTQLTKDTLYTTLWNLEQVSSWANDITAYQASAARLVGGYHHA